MADNLSLEERHRIVVRWFDRWQEETQDSRADAERDRDYYDGHQWTAAETAELKKVYF